MISALILAAGESKRMGQPKLLLPWRQSTVLGHVIQVFKSAAIEDVVVVTGGRREAVEEIARAGGARLAFNRDFASQEMLSSLQTGLRCMELSTQAALVALGDQPQVEESTVRMVAEEYRRTFAPLIVPSYEMHRGHPWLIARKFWDAVLAMRFPETPRDFLHGSARDIVYVELASPTILQDLDTPEDYLNSRQ